MTTAKPQVLLAIGLPSKKQDKKGVREGKKRGV